jgi:hypothetical protein
MSKTAQRDRLIASLPPAASLIRGSLVRYYHEGCRCHPNGRYGPYWYLSVNQGGRTKMRKLQAHQVPRVRQALRHYHRWWQTCLRIFELNAELALTEEA